MGVLQLQDRKSRGGGGWRRVEAGGGGRRREEGGGGGRRREEGGQGALTFCTQCERGRPDPAALPSARV